MKQTVKHSAETEKGEFWKYLFHVPQVLWNPVKFHQIPVRLCEVMNFCGTCRSNIARAESAYTTKDYLMSAASG